MVMNIEKLHFDTWVTCNAPDLAAGDIFRLNDIAYVAKDSARHDGKRWEIDAKPYYSNDIVINVGSERKYITTAQDYLGLDVPLTEFSDETFMLGSLGGGADTMYSPRLREKELNDFCRENIDVYERFYYAHQKDIERGKTVPISKFWHQTAE
ncbi:hypothetical protein VIBNISOn1_1050033 [Vibrio nigripulchritudo SOn1]|uniref:Uncharacterized protein n=1 Tax=Vibrio nigripulchritudo SOn1 TaxID=1238450 RepID=A0AAV2VHU4_9VIBR|nr:hypothetical protein [Vibrio nigripulchritudo]CCO44207.1 hypothetical protein VIBNISOn1_1050033 [Vibrio nigripulchritudo SOn1]